MKFQNPGGKIPPSHAHLRNCVDHLAAPSHIYAPPRVETGQ